MARKLNSNTIKPVISYVKASVNSRFYHFTLDTYNGKNSFQGGTAYDLDGCYTTPHYDKGETEGEPFDQYAIELETGNVIDLSTKTTVMQVTL